LIVDNKKDNVLSNIQIAIEISLFLEEEQSGREPGIFFAMSSEQM
jgi:hypothetical protein